MDKYGKPSIFSPVGITEDEFKSKKFMRDLAHTFDTADGFLCMCNTCARLWFIQNKYSDIIRFNQNLASIVGGNIKDKKYLDTILVGYNTQNSKDGLMMAIINNNGFLEMTCPDCIYRWVTDFAELLHDQNKNEICMNKDHGFYVTNSMINRLLPLIDKVFRPMFRGYTSMTELSKSAKIANELKNAIENKNVI